MEVSSKYAAVWQRVKVKLKIRRVLSSMRIELNLFGGDVRSADGTEPPKTKWHWNSERRAWWQGFILIVILYTTVALPLRTTFLHNYDLTLWRMSDLCVTLVFTSDIVLNMVAHTQEPRWIFPWTLLDFAACMPCEVLDVKPLFAWMHLCKLYRLLRISRVVKLSMTASEYHLSTKLKNLLRLNQTQLQLVLCLTTICLCIHLVTCAFYLSAVIVDFPPDCWVARTGQMDDSPRRLYLAALYWTVTTFATVGYGDIYCKTDTERLLGICWMISSVYFFSFTLSSLTSMFMSVETRQNVLLEKLALLDEFSKEAKLTTDVKMKIRDAVRYSSAQAVFSWSSNQDLFQELPKHLRYEVAVAMHRGAAKEIPFFSERPKEFLSATVPFLQNLRKLFGEVIIKEQEYADEIYFLSHGRVNYVFGDQMFVYKTLHQGSYFGDIEVLKQIPRKYTVSAAMDCSLLVMRKEVLEVIRSSFPGAWAEMTEVASVRENFNDKARLEAHSFIKLMKRGNLTLEPDAIRAQLAALQDNAVRLAPTMESLQDRLKLTKTRCALLEAGVKQAKTSLETLLDLLAHSYC